MPTALKVFTPANSGFS